MSSVPTTPVGLKTAVPTPSPKSSPRKPHGGLKLFPATPTLMDRPEDNHNLTTAFESAAISSASPVTRSTTKQRGRNLSVQSLRAQYEGLPIGQPGLRRTPAIKRPSSMRKGSELSAASNLSMDKTEKATMFPVNTPGKDEQKVNNTIRQVLEDEDIDIDEEEDIEIDEEEDVNVDGGRSSQVSNELATMLHELATRARRSKPVVYNRDQGDFMPFTPGAQQAIEALAAQVQPPTLPEISAQSFDVNFTPPANAIHEQANNNNIGNVNASTLAAFPMPPAASSIPLPASPTPERSAVKGRKRGRYASKTDTPVPRKVAKLTTPKKPEAIDIIISRTPQQEGDDTFFLYECVMKEDGTIQKLKESEVERCSPRVFKEWKKLQY